MQVFNQDNINTTQQVAPKQQNIANNKNHYSTHKHEQDKSKTSKTQQNHFQRTKNTTQIRDFHQTHSQFSKGTGTPIQVKLRIKSQKLG